MDNRSHMARTLSIWVGHRLSMPSLLCSTDQRLEHALDHQFLCRHQVRILGILSPQIRLTILDEERFESAGSVNQRGDDLPVARFWPMFHDNKVTVEDVLADH